MNNYDNTPRPADAGHPSDCWCSSQEGNKKMILPPEELSKNPLIAGPTVLILLNYTVNYNQDPCSRKAGTFQK